MSKLPSSISCESSPLLWRFIDRLQTQRLVKVFPRTDRMGITSEKKDNGKSKPERLNIRMSTIIFQGVFTSLIIFRSNTSLKLYRISSSKICRGQYFNMGNDSGQEQKFSTSAAFLCSTSFLLSSHVVCNHTKKFCLIETRELLFCNFAYKVYFEDAIDLVSSRPIFSTAICIFL